MDFFELGQHANDPRSRRMIPKYLQLQLHGIRLLLTEQKTCSYSLEFAHIRLVKEFADILKPQHLSRHNSFLYFFPNLFLPKSSLPKSIAQGHRRTLATVRYYPPGQTRLGHINTIQEVFLWLRFAWILTC